MPLDKHLKRRARKLSTESNFKGPIYIYIYTVFHQFHTAVRGPTMLSLKILLEHIESIDTGCVLIGRQQVVCCNITL